MLEIYPLGFLNQTLITLNIMTFIMTLFVLNNLIECAYGRLVLRERSEKI